jgi:hypothetical protein
VEENVKKIGNMKFGTLILTILFGLSAWSQTPSVTLSSSKTEVAVGEQFEVKIKANVNGSAEIKFPSGFSAQGPKVSSQVQIINGKRTQEYAQTFYVTATQEGTFTIPAILWKYGSGKNVQSKPLKITVKKGATTIANTNQLKHFVEMTSSKKEVYLGEPFVLNAIAFSRSPLLDKLNNPVETSLRIDRSPLHETYGKLITGQQKRDGFDWHTLVVFEDIIIPLEVGNLEFNPLNVVLGIARDFFGLKTGNFLSNAVNVKVRPLPDGAPASFYGIVGDFQAKLTADVLNQNLQVGDVFSLDLRLSGKGNFKQMKTLALILPEGLSLYGEPKIDNQVFETSQGFHGHLDYEFIIQVDKPGKYDFQAFDFSFFNPETHQYASIEIPNLRFEASGDVPIAVDNDTQNNYDFNKTEQQSPWIWIVLVVSLGIGLLVFGARHFLKKNSLKEKSITKKPKVDARALALKSLETVTTNDLKETADAIEKIILQYFRNLTQNDDLLLDNDWFNNSAQTDFLSSEKAQSWSQHFANIQALKYAGFGGENAEGLVRKTRELVGG